MCSNYYIHGTTLTPCGFLEKWQFYFLWSGLFPSLDTCCHVLVFFPSYSVQCFIRVFILVKKILFQYWGLNGCLVSILPLSYTPPLFKYLFWELSHELSRLFWNVQFTCLNLSIAGIIGTQHFQDNLRMYFSFW